VRELVVTNASYWIGVSSRWLRLDATQTIVDESPLHIIAE